MLTAKPASNQDVNIYTPSPSAEVADVWSVSLNVRSWRKADIAENVIGADNSMGVRSQRARLAKSGDKRPNLLDVKFGLAVQEERYHI